MPLLSSLASAWAAGLLGCLGCLGCWAAPLPKPQLPLLGAAELQTDKLLPAVPLLWLLCRYAAIFKHAKDELGFCYYLIPCGKKAGQMGSCTVRCSWGGPRKLALALALALAVHCDADTFVDICCW